MVGGIVYIVVPLLSLTANQESKLKMATQTHATVKVHHLDEIDKQSVNNKIIPRMKTIPCNSSTTIFLISFSVLGQNANFHTALLHCQPSQTLRLICVDEVHLYTEQMCVLRISSALVSGPSCIALSNTSRFSFTQI